jgi:hypothetical protein
LSRPKRNGRSRQPNELADYGPQIDNLRAALDWAFSPHGNIAIGVGADGDGAVSVDALVAIG